MQTVWCWPPEKPTQDLVEFLNDVRFWGIKQDSVPGVPGGKARKALSGGKVSKALPFIPSHYEATALPNKGMDVITLQVTRLWF